MAYAYWSVKGALIHTILDYDWLDSSRVFISMSTLRTTDLNYAYWGDQLLIKVSFPSHYMTSAQIKIIKIKQNLRQLHIILMNYELQ